MTIVIRARQIVYGLLVLTLLSSRGMCVEPESSKDFLAAAFEAELKGDNSARDGLLHRALAKNPSNALARSMLGQIKTADGWVDVEQAAADSVRDPIIREYQRRRLQVQGAPGGQMILARFCAKHDLKDRAQFHWRMVLLRQPGNKEAAAALALQRHKGRLLTADQISEFDARAELLQNSSIQVNRLADILRSEQPRDEDSSTKLPSAEDSRDTGTGSLEADKQKAELQLAAIREPLAIPALERVVSGDNSRASLSALQAIVGIQDRLAANALARQATLNRNADIRELARAALKKRSLHEYVPQLLGALTTPIRVSGNINRLDNGLVYSISLSREGAEAEFVQQTYGASTPNRLRRGANTRIRANRTSAAASTINRQIRTLQQQASLRNRQGQLVNQRLFETLRAATGQDIQDSPQQWWDWWAQYNDLYIPQDKPQVVNYRQLNPLLSHECFLAGTLVWTDLGLRPIERLRAGDRVLTCDPHTGEISHQYILLTTVRPSLETTRIELPGEDIVVTDGHPIWVLGKGWRMSKNIKSGDLLHGVRGAVQVTDVGKGPGADVYNLVVDRVNNYFVGATGVLAHDNTIRQPNNTDAPGRRSTAPTSTP